MDANLFGHLANVLFGLAYLVKDILWLRLISIVACFIMVFFNYFAPEEPLWVAIYWNIGFISVNAIRSFMLFLERREARFSDAEQEIYDSVFRHMSPIEFAKVLKNGAWEYFDEGASILKEGELPKTLTLLYRGSAKVQKDDKDRGFQLSDGAFIGEMSLVTDSFASANVEAETEIKAYCWPRENLDNLFKKNPNLKASFQLAIASDMAQKLRSA